MESAYGEHLKYGHLNQCYECIGLVAVIDCNNLNKYVFLSDIKHGLTGPYLAADCSQAIHTAQRKTDLIAEVDWNKKVEWKMNTVIKDAFVIMISR